MDAGRDRAELAPEVTFLNPAFWPEVRRGSERVIADLGAGLVDRGWRPTLIASRPGAQATRLEGGMRVELGRRLPERPLRRLGYYEMHGHAPSTWRALRRLRPQLMHAFYPVEAALAVSAARRHGGSVIFSAMGIARPTRIAARRLRAIAWATALDADAVVALSQAAAEPLRQMGAEVRVIPPGVDLSAFRPTAERAPNPTIICPADPAARRKRIVMLVEAFAELRDRVADAKLWLNDVNADRLGPLPAGVELRALSDKRALAADYSRAWLTALPAREEAFGLVLVESLACGTPVVGADEGGVRDIVDDPSIGLRFAPDEPEDLLQALLDGLELAHQEGAAERCRRSATRFSVEQMIERYVELYSELGHSGPNSASARAVSGEVETHTS